VTTVAAIDCGTNSIRLLIARTDGADRLVDVERTMRVVRLGEGVDATGALSAAALQRTFAAARVYRDTIEDCGVSAVRFVATSASRDASNAHEFTAGIEDILGVGPEVISGAEEAELSFTGAVRGSGLTGRALVFDIGGGSTEFIVGDTSLKRPDAAVSVDMGCVRYTERYATRDPLSAGDVRAMRAACAELLDRAGEVVDLAGPRYVLGLAGTVTTVTALALGLGEYDSQRIHLASVPASAVTRVSAELLAMTVAQRNALAVMHPGRADVIAAGSIILDEILRRCGTDTLTASEHDILDGIAWSLLDGRDDPIEGAPGRDVGLARDADAHREVGESRG
jgi:exopolyphosphatase/guanosine-5'-triphosphate,3'-diphosphate pyrophosphatase